MITLKGGSLVVFGALFNDCNNAESTSLILWLVSADLSTIATFFVGIV